MLGCSSPVPVCFGERWPPSAPAVGLSVGCSCAPQLGEQSGLLMSPKAIKLECKDRGWGSWDAPELHAAQRGLRPGPAHSAAAETVSALQY